MSARITPEEIAALTNAKTEQEWNALCDQIKSAHGGYPVDWYAKVMLSGLGAEKEREFKATSKPMPSIPGIATVHVSAPEANPAAAARLEEELKRQGY